VGALYQTDHHQFGNTVEELFLFLQTRDPDRIEACRIDTLTSPGFQDFARMTVEETLQIDTNYQVSGLFVLSRQVR